MTTSLDPQLKCQVTCITSKVAPKKDKTVKGTTKFKFLKRIEKPIIKTN